MSKPVAPNAAPRIELPRPGRGKRHRAAVVALEGASPSDLARSWSLAAQFDARPRVVAVDGGLATCRARRLRPDVFVGDLDSTRRAPAGIPSVIFPAAKDFSDFAGALGELVRLGVDLVVIAGLVGGRLDHEWANVLEAGAMARRFSCVVAPSSRGLVVVTARTVKVATAENALVSVFALHGAARVTLAGTSWTLERRRVSPGSLGLSNRSAGSLRLQVHSGVVALILPRTNRYRIPTLSRKESTSRPTRSR